MRSLYISDLDGTLLNSNKEVTPYSAQVLNAFISGGGLFTVATARTSYGCDTRLLSLNLNTPAVLMNGVALYDFSKKQYVDARPLHPDSVASVEQVLNAHGLGAFLYALEDHRISLYYKNEDDLQHTQYYSQRAVEECRTIEQTPSFSTASQGRTTVYIALTGEQAQIEAVRGDIGGISGIKHAMYLNIYNGLYCLEIFSKDAGKAAALAQLKELLKPDEVVVFGDNHNDLSMMEIADRSYATANAIDEVKAAATAVIGSCDEDGVARLIQQEQGIEVGE